MVPINLIFSTITADDKSVSTNSVPSLSCSQQINLKLTDLLFDADGNPEASANYVIDFNPAGAFRQFSLDTAR